MGAQTQLCLELVQESCQSGYVSMNFEAEIWLSCTSLRCLGERANVGQMSADKEDTTSKDTEDSQFPPAAFFMSCYINLTSPYTYYIFRFTKPGILSYLGSRSGVSPDASDETVIYEEGFIEVLHPSSVLFGRFKGREHRLCVGCRRASGSARRALLGRLFC